MCGSRTWRCSTCSNEGMWMTPQIIAVMVIQPFAIGSRRVFVLSW